MLSSLKKLFVKEDRFLTLLEASASEGCNSVKALAQILKAPQKADLGELLKSRKKEQQVASEIDELLCQSFTTPLEREDIETLARALNKISKSVKKFAERYLISCGQLSQVDFSEQVASLQLATQTVLAMIQDLKTGVNLGAAKENNQKLQQIEGQADVTLALALEQLYEGKRDDLEAIILKDLYELLERAFDRCRTAGNIVLQIVLKNS